MSGRGIFFNRFLGRAGKYDALNRLGFRALVFRAEDLPSSLNLNFEVCAWNKSLKPKP